MKNFDSKRLGHKLANSLKGKNELGLTHKDTDCEFSKKT